MSDDKFVEEWKKIMEPYQSGWEEISQAIDEHINLRMERYLETGKVFKCISATMKLKAE